MQPLSDHVLDHLRRATNLPDLSGTRYELEREIGRGGMGVVYEVKDKLLGRRVAMKVIDDGGAVVLDEARVMAELEHPGIVPLHDAGRLPDDRFFYVMKLVKGVRLDQFIASGAPLTELLRCFVKVCDAVAFAHSHGVIHRDLKPQNIMVESFGQVLVMDWGIAHRISATNTAIAGTPSYMAPEQAAGEPPDARADVFSLGAILKDLLPPNSPRPLLAVFAKACSTRREDRYGGVAELRSDVLRYMDGLAVAAYHESVPERAWRFAVRNRTLLLLLATYVVVRFLLYFLR